MIPVSDSLEMALQGGSFSAGWVADLIVDGEVKLEDVSLSPCEVTSDASANVVTQGSATFTFTDDLGSSIVPSDVSSWLSPFASFLDISYRVAVGDQSSEKVLRGRLKIVGASDPNDRSVTVEGRRLSVGSQVSLKLADLMHVTDRERFIAPTGPGEENLGSIREEIARLTGFSIVTDVSVVPDGTIPRSVAYKENRLEAVQDLAAVLGAVPWMDASGGLALAPKAWGDPVAVLRVGPEGTVFRADPDELSDEGVYNQVVVTAHDADQATILATAQVESGPLRYGGPFGRVPYMASSPYVTTKDQARVYAASLLPEVSSLPAVSYTVQCAADPRLEVWDVVTVVTEDDRTFDARIQKITLPDSGSMSLKVQVKS